MFFFHFIRNSYRTFFSKILRFTILFWFWFPDCGRPVHVGRSVSRFGDAFRHVKVLCRTDPTFPRISRHTQHRDGRQVRKRPQVIIVISSYDMFPCIKPKQWPLAGEFVEFEYSPKICHFFVTRSGEFGEYWANFCDSLRRIWRVWRVWRVWRIWRG